MPKLRYRIRLIFDFILYMLEQRDLFKNEDSWFRNIIRNLSLTTKIENQTKKIVVNLRAFSAGAFSEEGDYLKKIGENRQMDTYEFYQKYIYKEWKKLSSMLASTWDGLDPDVIYDIYSHPVDEVELIVYITAYSVDAVADYMKNVCAEQWSPLRFAQCNYYICRMRNTLNNIHNSR